MITVESRTGSSGVMIIGKSKPAPCRAGTQNPGAIPCGTKMPANRVLVSVAD
jgi:hypothetical protein